MFINGPLFKRIPYLKQLSRTYFQLFWHSEHDFLDQWIVFNCFSVPLVIICIHISSKGAVIIYDRGWGWGKCFLLFKNSHPTNMTTTFLLPNQAVTQLFLYPTPTQQIFLIFKFCRHIKGECEPSGYYWFSSTNFIISAIKNPMKQRTQYGLFEFQNLISIS